MFRWNWRPRRPPWTFSFSVYTNGYVYYIPNQRDLDEVHSWTLDEYLSQDNRWAYGATSSAFWSGESCEALKAAARTLVESLATGK